MARAALGIAIVLLIGLVVLHLGPVQEKLKEVVESQVENRLVGTLRIGELDYRLWLGNATLTDVVLELDEGLLSRAIIDTVRIDYRFPASVKVTAVAPSILLEATEETGTPDETDATSPPRSVASILPAYLDALEVEDGELRYSDPSSSIQARIAPLRVSMSSDGLDSLREISVSAEGGEATWQSRRIEMASLSAAASLMRDNVRIDSATLRSNVGSLNVEGDIESLRPFASSLTVEHALDLGAVLPLQGEVEGTARLAVSGGTLSGEGRFQASGLKREETGPYSGETEWSLSDEVFTLASDLQGDGLVADVDARLDLAAETQELEIEIVADSLQETLDASGGPKLPWDGPVEMTATASLSGFEPSTLDGEVRIALSDGDGGKGADDLSGSIDVAAVEGDLEIETNDLSFPGGAIEATASIQDFETLTASYRLDVDSLATALEPFEADPPEAIRGQLELAGEANGNLQDVSALRVTARLRGSEVSIGEQPFSLDGFVALDDGTLRIEDVSLEGDEGSFLTLSGRMPLEREGLSVEGRMAELSLAPFTHIGGVPFAAEAGGRFEASGSLSSPRFDANLELSSIEYRGETLPSLGFRVRSSERKARLQASLLESGSRFLDATVALQSPYESEADIDLDPLPWDTISNYVPAVAGRAPTLEVSGRAHVSGPLERPSELEGEAGIERLSARIGERVLSTSSFRIEGGADAVEISGLTIQEGSTEILSVEGRLPLESGVEGDLEIRADVPLDLVEDWMPGTDAGGSVRADLRLSGGPTSPELFGAIDIDDASYARDGLRLSSVNLRARATGTEIRIESLDAQVLEGELTAEGTIPLPLPGVTADATSRIEFDITAIDPSSIQAEGNAKNFETSVSLAGELRFPGRDFSRLRASGELQEIFLATDGALVFLAEPAPFTYGPSGLRTEPIHLEGGETDLRIVVEALGGEDETPVRVAANGQIDLVLGNVALPDDVFLSGLARLNDVRVRLDEGYDLSGSGRLSEVELVLETPPLALTDLEGDFDLEGRTVELTGLEGDVGGGGVEARARVALPRGDDSLDANLRIEADDVRLEYPEGLRSRISATLQLAGAEGDENRFLLEGTVRIDEAIYEQDISPAVQLFKAARRESLDLAEEPGLTGRIDLEIDVQSGRDLVVDNNLGRLQANADVVVTGTVASPEITGTVRAVPGGLLSFGANVYEIETARVALTSFPVLPPELNIRARTEAGGREIVLAVEGRTDNLQTTLQSPTDASLSRADAASLLLTGRTVEEARGEEGEILAEQAAGYFGGELADVTEQGLSAALPVTSVNLDPTLVGRETDPGVRFSVGQSVTEELMLTYSIGLNDAEEQLWIIDYELPHQLVLRAIREDANEYTGALSQERFFDFYQRARPTTLPEEEPKPEIADLRIEGAAPVSDAQIWDAAGLEPGDDYDYWSARDAADRIVSKLREADFLNARVNIETMPPEAEADLDVAGEEDETVVLVFDVDAGPRIELEWTGDAIEDELRAWAREAFQGYIPPRAQAARLERDLVYRLMSDGYYGASVDATVEETSEDVVRVTFDVALGPRGEDVVVELEGNQNIEKDVLVQVLPDPSEPEFFEHVIGHPAEVREELRLLYASEGFLAASADLSSAVSPEGDRLTVRITIEEGDRFSVSDVAIEDGERFEMGELREIVQIEEGEPFHLGTYLEDRRALASFYRREGFPDALVTGELRRAGDDAVSVRYRIDERERIEVGSVRVEGARATGEGVIWNAVTFEPGDPLRLSDLTDTQSNLYELQIFRSVDVRTVPSEEEGRRDVLIDVTELPDLRLGYGMRYSTEDDFEGSGDVHLPNLLGGARQLTLSAFANRRQQIYRVNLVSPYFFVIDLDTSVFLARELEQTDTFDASSWTFTFQQGLPLRDHLRLQWSATYDLGSVVETVPSGPFPFDVQAARSILSLALIEDTRNSLTRPTRGRFWTVNAEYAPARLGSDINFMKFYGQFFFFRPLTDQITWASSYRAGIADAFDQVLLPQDRFRAGGPSSVRGFPVNELGDPDPLIGAPIGGEGVLIMNQELRFPLFWRFGGVTFYDVGNVYLQAEDFDPTNVKHSLGAGLTVDLPVGLVSIDWARVLNPSENQDRSRLHISFGYAF